MDQTVLFQMGLPVVDVLAGLLLRMDVAVHTPLPPGPKIFAPNHPSTSDPFLVLTLTREPVSILIEERLFKVPVFGDYLRQAGHIEVIRDNGRQAFEEARRRLQSGQNISIFPEGAISPPDGGFHPARTGAARLALETGAPVIPVGIHLDRARIRRITTMVEGSPAVGTWYMKGPYAMTVGDPMRFSGSVGNRLLVRMVSDQIMRRIASLARESADRMLNRKAITMVSTGEFRIAGGTI